MFTFTLRNFASIISLAVFMASSQILLAANTSQTPVKGMTQEEVKAQFGEPSQMKAPVGKPPIARWDYENYSVYFEDKYVIHSFLHNKRTRPTLNPKPSTATVAQPAVKVEQAKEPGTNTVEELKPEAKQSKGSEKAEEVKKTIQPVPAAPATEVPEEVVIEESTDTEVVEEIVETELSENPEALVEKEMEKVEQVIAEEKPVKAEVAEATPKATKSAKEKDLNFEEAPQNADFGKWAN